MLDTLSSEDARNLLEDRVQFKLYTAERHLKNLQLIDKNGGLDLWNYEFEGAGLRKALDYIIPYALNEKPWPYKQIIPIKKMPSYDTNLAKLSCHYENNELYVEAYKSVNKDKLDINVYYPICNQIVS
jgi:hypothetical protein